MNQFYVGQDVVCFDNGQPANTTLPSELVKGQVYKLRWVGIHRHYLDGEYLGVRLVGVDRGTCKIWGDVDTPFKASRFRPLVNNKLELLRQVAAGLPIQGDEGPVRGKPDGGGVVKEREKEEV